MLSFNQQYDISNGIFLTFDKDLPVRKMTSNHSMQVRDKAKCLFPYQKFESWTKERFAIAVVYLMYVKRPPSFKNLLQMLRELDENKVLSFKSDIINYSLYVSKDIDYLVQIYGSLPTIENMFFEYINGKIKFYTLWFYLKKINGDLNELIESRIKSPIVRRIQSLLLFVSFNGEKLNKIDILLKERLDI